MQGARKDKAFLNANEVAKQLGISPATLTRYARRLGFRRTITGRWLISQEDIQTLVNTLTQKYWK